MINVKSENTQNSLSLKDPSILLDQFLKLKFHGLFKLKIIVIVEIQNWIKVAVEAEAK